MTELLPREHLTQLINEWLKENPEEALEIAKSALIAYFVDNDEKGESVQLNPHPNLDSSDIDVKLFPVIEHSEFRRNVWKHCS